MTERKGAAYRITSRKAASTGQEHHQRTHVSEMYERMAPDDVPVYGGATMDSRGAWAPVRRPRPPSSGGRMSR